MRSVALPRMPPATRRGNVKLHGAAAIAWGGAVGGALVIRGRGLLDADLWLHYGSVAVSAVLLARRRRAGVLPS